MMFLSPLQKITVGLLIAAFLIPTFGIVAERYVFDKSLSSLQVTQAQITVICPTCSTLVNQLLSYIVQGYQLIKETGIYLNTLYNNIFNSWVQNVFKVLLEYFKLKLLDMLSTQIVNWITGGSLKGPQYVTNWSNFLGQASRDALNIAINEVDRASGGLICTNFATQLRNLLRTRILLPGVSSFQGQISCTLDKVISNINSFYADFSRGGWSGYITLIQPNNNYYGNMISILDYREQVEAARQRAAQNEGLASQGYISVKKCKAQELGEDYTPTGNCLEWEITTPGKALAASVDSALTNRFGYIFGMEQFASIIAILTDSVLNKLIGAGIQGLVGAAKGVIAVEPGAGYIPIGTDFVNCDIMPPGPDRDACLLNQASTQPDAMLTLSAAVINAGQEISLSWAGINATSCSGANFSTGGQITGSIILKPAETTTYSLTCRNASGGVVTKFATITVLGGSVPTSTEEIPVP